MANRTPPRREPRKTTSTTRKGKKEPGYQAKVDVLVNQLADSRSKTRGRFR